MSARLARALAAALACALALAGVALADGDPASDVLLGESVFYPYSPPVSAALQSQLNAETAAAANAKFPIKVALIATPVDLGTIPDLFGKPQQYADFLDQEISFTGGRQKLLVVMAAGYGVQGLPPAASAAAGTLPKPAGGASNDLAKAALTAVSKLATAAGHPLQPAAPSGGSSGNGTSRTVLLIILIVAAVITAAALLLVRRKEPSAR